MGRTDLFVSGWDISPEDVQICRSSEDGSSICLGSGQFGKVTSHPDKQLVNQVGMGVSSALACESLLAFAYLLMLCGCRCTRGCGRGCRTSR